MQKDIKVLLRVQEEDITIRSLKRESQVLPEKLKAIKEKQKEAENRVKEKQEEIKKIQVAHKELEIDFETKQGDIKKHETQLFQLKTNEEYKAMQKQINDVKFECGLLEDKILEKLEQIEKVQKELKDVEDVLASAKQNVGTREKEIKSKIDAITSDIQRIQKERDELTQGVSVEFLRKYESIFSNKQDAALVSVENKTCQGCHMILPPNVINEVKKSTGFVICDNCARILYL